MKNRILGIFALSITLVALVFTAGNILKYPQNLSILTGTVMGMLVVVMVAQLWNIYKNKNNWAIKAGYGILMLAIIVPAIGIPYASSLPGPTTSGAGEFGPGFAVGIGSLLVSLGLFSLASLSFVIGAFLKDETTTTSPNP